VVYPNQIIENIFLSSEICSQNLDVLKNLNIRYILNICNSSNMFEDNDEYRIVYLKYPTMFDSENCKIYSIFPECYNFLDNVFNNNTRVLVHCNQGRSRSSTVVIAYLMKKFNWRYKPTYDYVKELRPLIQPNEGFIEQLKIYEEELFS